MESETLYYNDINFIVKDLIESFRHYDTYDYIRYVKKFIEKYKLEKGNKETYLAAREYYNSLPETKKDIRMLFAIILYSYQQQIRFNSNYGFNNTAGVRWFNDCILAKLVSFSRVIKKKNVSFLSVDYIYIREQIKIDENTFLYLDPPYKLTTHDCDVQFVENDYEDEFIDAKYNQGRLGILQYHNTANYISFSDEKCKGRNSGIQSVPTAFHRFYSNAHQEKKLYFYFLPCSGNNATPYYLFMYRLMKTAGFHFINVPSALTGQITGFSSIEDIIRDRKENRDRNSGNNATYILLRRLNIDVFTCLNFHLLRCHQSL